MRASHKSETLGSISPLLATQSERHLDFPGTTQGERGMSIRQMDGTNPIPLSIEPVDFEDRRLLDEESFHRMIAVERKRTERSGKPFLLVLMDTGDALPTARVRSMLTTAADALSLSIRDTDFIGWYKEGSVVGVMFTEVADDRNSMLMAMLTRVSGTLRDNLSADQFSQVGISLHLYPDDWEHELFRRPSNPLLYPDLSQLDESRKFAIAIKRLMDIVGSAIALLIFSPLFLLIALAIKLTSKGPVFFRQERVGQHGRTFVLLKFRSMHAKNDADVHKEWFSKFMNNQAELHRTSNNKSGSFKMMNDPRVTRVGRWVRRTSLDELPQLINVFRGEMSLVGPRPPIPYEVNAYQTWHRARILEARPGMTGLWQVSGRSRVTFDEMVRLDVRYARTWSLWLDIKILLRTPLAVLMGEGAY
jgi:lipopolysaccharide/colanic/teichoic acid biosynthesis glycosyltransferase